MPKKRTTRIYKRERGGPPRYYVDLRDLGGGCKRLVAPGEKAATTDPDIAAVLAAQEVEKLEQRRRKRTILGIEKETTLAKYVRHQRNWRYSTIRRNRTAFTSSLAAFHCTKTERPVPSYSNYCDNSYASSSFRHRRH